MLYTIPDYYKEFCCTADACEDTCCAGWQIAVDPKALRKYRKVQGSYAGKLKQCVNWKKSVFRQDKERRCAFLNDDNLCDMYANLGKDSLCRTCRLYPRHVEEFEGVREITLSMSCPEVARILLNKKETVHFRTVAADGEEEYEDFDPFLYSQLVDARGVIIDILQNREYSVSVRMKLMLGIAHDMQNRVDQGQLFACQEVCEKYKKAAAAKYVEPDLAQTSAKSRFIFAKELCEMLERMEFLKEDWYIQLFETKQRLYDSEDAKAWEKLSLDFETWLKDREFSWEIQKEQLLVYFISTYYCGAVYDEDIFGKAWMTAASVVILEEMLKARWIRNEKVLDMEDIVSIVYRYCREIEHSDSNLLRIQRQAKIYRVAGTKIR